MTNRRDFSKTIVCLPLVFRSPFLWSDSLKAIPAVGMGTSRTFNVGSSLALRKSRLEVLRTFFEMGGKLIDSSPMYGTSEEVIGYCLRELNKSPKDFVSATKVWTSSTDEGKKQFKEALKLWGQKKIDIYQIHNLLNWEEHLKVLRKYKQMGTIQSIGITTSHGRRLDDLAALIKKEPIDYLQITYNMEERWNESVLLPLALKKKIPVIVNRPFQRGDLFDKVKSKKLPEWIKEYEIKTWSQFFLKWAMSHPAVSYVIPATSKVVHMKENMGALKGPLPDAKVRARMLTYYQSL